MASILNNDEVNQEKNHPQTQEVFAEPDDTNQDVLFVQTLLHRSPQDTDAITSTPDSPSKHADATTQQETIPPPPTLSSSHTAGHSGYSGYSTPFRHARYPSTSTVPTSPGQFASPHIKAVGDALLEPVEEDQALSSSETHLPAIHAPAAVSSTDDSTPQEQPSTLVPEPARPGGRIRTRTRTFAATQGGPARDNQRGVVLSESEREATSASRSASPPQSSSARATRGSDADDHARRHRRRRSNSPAELLWFQGAQFVSDSAAERDGVAVLQHLRRRRAKPKPRNYKVVVDQDFREDTEPAYVALLRKFVRLQMMQTVFVGTASLVVIGVALYRL